MWLRTNIAIAVAGLVLALGTLQCGLLGATDAEPPDDGGDGSHPDVPDVDADANADTESGDVSGGGHCTPGDLVAALEAAQDGDTVWVGLCRIEGLFEVPPGVTLRGTSRERSILASPPELRQPVLKLAPGTPTNATRVVDLTVESSANCGVLARDGTGQVDLERVTVRSSRGIAVGVESIGTLKLTDVALEGPYTTGSGAYVDPVGAVPETTATHGLVVWQAGTTDLTDLRASGFAGIGVALVDTQTHWTGGGAPDNLGTGLVVVGNAATLTDIDLSGSHWSRAPLVDVLPGTPWSEPTTEPAAVAFGGVFVDGAGITSTRLTVSNGEHFGLFHDGGSGTHTGLLVENNGDVGVWAQDVQSLTLDGPDAAIANNHFAGVALIEPNSFQLRNLMVRDTGWGCHVCAGIDALRAGDGIDLIRPQAAGELSSLELRNNARIGLVIDLGGLPVPEITMTGINVFGTGLEMGAAFQNGTFPPAWDASVVRDGITADNDGLRDNPLGIPGRLSTKFLPKIGRLTREGLIGIINPDPPS